MGGNSSKLPASIKPPASRKSPAPNEPSSSPPPPPPREIVYKEKIVYTERDRTPCENKMDQLQKQKYDNKTYESKLCNASECKNDSEFKKGYGKEYCKYEGFTSLIEAYTPRIQAAALQSAREAEGAAQDSKKYAKYASNEGENANFASKTAQSASILATSSSGIAKTASEGAQNSAQGAQNSAQDAQISAQGVQNSAQDAQNSAQDAQISATKTQVLEEDVETMHQNTESDVFALQQTIGLHTNTGSTAAEISRKSRELEEKEGQLEQVEEHLSKQPFTNIKEYFTNLIEGNTGMSGTTTESLVQNNDNFIDTVRGFLDTSQTSLNIDKTNLENSIDNIKRYQDGEFLAQKDTIMNNVLMDYMINNKEGSNIEQVYGKLNQEKNDKLRKTKIAAYYTKSFKEYIYLLKIVIFLIVLMIPILIFNRLEILDKSLTLLLVVTIITLGFLYISYRLYILYTRDNKDFDKFKIPFTRTEAARLKDNKSRYSKDSPLKSFGITCIGEECCDASMVYDKLRDKCVATENFGNYFENAQQLNNQQKNIIKENNSHEDESNFAFLGGNANVIENFRSMEGIKQGLLLESLNNSTERTF
tara:strand:- start:78 stop:1850 length:1773 start_codon:yes stop_codon:yes gene_type:complete